MDTGAPGPSGHPYVEMMDAQAKAKVANLETTESRFRDFQAASLDRSVARRIRNETIGGIVLLVCIAIATFILFFLI